MELRQEERGEALRGCMLGCAPPLGASQPDSPLPALRGADPACTASLSLSTCARVWLSLSLDGRGTSKVCLCHSARNPGRRNEVYENLDLGFSFWLALFVGFFFSVHSIDSAMRARLKEKPYAIISSFRCLS